MIVITPPIHGFLCQNCLRRDDVMEIEVGRDGASAIIRLCADCRQKLAKAISAVDHAREQTPEVSSNDRNQICT